MNADDLAKLLDELGKRLGPTGERVFALAIRQIYIDSIVILALCIVFAIASVIAIPRVYRWQQADKGYMSNRAMVCTFGGLIYVLVGLVLAWCGIIALTNLLNPEYAAIRDLMGSVR